MHVSRLSALVLFGLTTAVGAAIPIDHYDDLTFDAPIENRIRAGDALRIGGRVDDPSITGLQIAFETDAGDRLDYFFLVRPDGHFERDLVFLESQTGSYHVHVFAGVLGEAFPYKGTFSQVVIDGLSDPVLWPAGYFDGVRLTAPLPLRWPVGRPLRMQGQILDPRVRQARFDVDTPAGTRSVVIPHADGHFDAIIHFTEQDQGLVQLDLVTGLPDGNYWGRGAITIEVNADPLPRLQVQALALSMSTEGVAVIPLANVGTGDLILHPPTLEGPFHITATPRGLAPGARGEIRVQFDGTPPATGTLSIHSDDPQRPRIDVALTGLAPTDPTRIDWHRSAGDIALAAGDQIVALYALPNSDQEISLPFVLGQPPLSLGQEPAARAVPTARDLGEAELRHREAVLAAQVAARGALPAARPVAALAQVGDQRDFIFDEFAGVAARRVPATVVALSRHAVAWAHDGSGAGRSQLPTSQIQQMLDQFDTDYDLLVSSLGQPSDVDGDDHIHFLYTPLVDSTGFGGFVDAASILPSDVGGNGNQSDLIFVALDEPASSYRSLLAHEFQHLISFNEHVLVRFGSSEVSWLNEGLSHVAEDLVDGHARGGNADRVATYLADPARVGLIGDASISAAKRGGAYLFVRSLVDRFGPPILLQLIGTGLADTDNLARATGEAFEDLLAGFAAQLAISGAGLGQHPRFDFGFEDLAPEGRRGFGAPRMVRLDATDGSQGQIPNRGLSFFRVHAEEAGLMSLAAAPEAGIRAVVLPIPVDFELPVHIPGSFFRGVRLESSLPAVLNSGEAVRLTGHIDTTLFPPGSGERELVFEYEPAEGEVGHSFNLAIDGERFEGDIIFAHAQHGDYGLAVFARWTIADETHFEWLGTFTPALVRIGDGVVHLPPLYFDRLRLDAPWPTRMRPDDAADLGGVVLNRPAAPELVLVQVDLASATDTLSVRMEVVDGRFSGRLELADHPRGLYSLNVFGQDAEGRFTWLGGTDHFEVGDVPVTAILGAASVRPGRAELGNSYPNPFNSHTVIPFQLAEDGPVRLVVFSLSGQRVADWDAGQLPAGIHQWRWDARAADGQPLASGVYFVQLQIGPWRRTGKVLLLR